MKVRGNERCLMCWCVVAMLGCTWPAELAAVEAVRGKNYALTKQHGPWMIMVASFRNVPKDRRTEGLSAEEAALELVYELRKMGIPAYTHATQAVVEKIETIDRLGREDERVYVAQWDRICVLAGNWKSIDDKEAQKTLAAIKRYYPKFLRDEKSGAVFRVTPGKKGPLGGAFMTLNPLLDPSEVVSSKPDPDLIRLNNSTPYPLIGCKKRYSVQVATFTGTSVLEKQAEEFEKHLHDPNAYNLNRAGEDAEQLVRALREEGIEAYVHHDRYQSIVTIGSFDNPTDPRAQAVILRYGPAYREDPANPGEQRLLPYVHMKKRSDDPNVIPHFWAFDLQPRVIEVPRVR
ncbi:MAG: hypothetical protein KatS3mg114_1244 [Planctomycetaceae bacterium]|nr:MAG: hypothetical protein KatS3mg114_1244 [Planctomycetaceae bacterium]